MFYSKYFASKSTFWWILVTDNIKWEWVTANMFFYNKFIKSISQHVYL